MNFLWIIVMKECMFPNIKTLQFKKFINLLNKFLILLKILCQIYASNYWNTTNELWLNNSILTYFICLDAPTRFSSFKISLSWNPFLLRLQSSSWSPVCSLPCYLLIFHHRPDSGSAVNSVDCSPIPFWFFVSSTVSCWFYSCSWWVAWPLLWALSSCPRTLSAFCASFCTCHQPNRSGSQSHSH